MELRKPSLAVLLGACIVSAAGFGQNTFPSSGNVGIGTTSPLSALDTNGTIRSTGASSVTSGAGLELYYNGVGRLQSWNRSTNQGIPLGIDGNVIYLNGYSGGNVAIGNTNPLYTLDITGTERVTGSMISNQSGGGTNSGFEVSSIGAAYAWYVPNQGTDQKSWDALATGTSLLFRTVNDANSLSNVWMQVNRSTGYGIGTISFPLGNVGVGTSNPQAKFEINGNLRFTADGSVQTTAWTGVLCGGDYAEAVETTEVKANYEPGDVLVISAEAEGKVEKSSEPYATNVSGIYATKPGVVGKRESLAKVADDIPMAMVGIVPTKVSAENGAIHPGDLLVTSSKAGYAMKGTDRTRMLGAVIGKAMETLQSGEGAIEVLVTLQ